MEYHLDMHAPADTFHFEALSLRDLIFSPCHTAVICAYIDTLDGFINVN